MKDPLCVLVKNNKLKSEEGDPIVTVTHKMGRAVKNFHAAEIKYNSAESLLSTRSRGLRLRLVIYQLSAL